MHKIQAAGQAALHHGSDDPKVSEVSAVGRDSVWSLWKDPIGGLHAVQTLRILEQSLVVLCR